jgi:hypothetical protein
MALVLVYAVCADAVYAAHLPPQPLLGANAIRKRQRNQQPTATTTSQKLSTQGTAPTGQTNAPTKQGTETHHQRPPCPRYRGKGCGCYKAKRSFICLLAGRTSPQGGELLKAARSTSKVCINFVSFDNKTGAWGEGDTIKIPKLMSGKIRIEE